MKNLSILMTCMLFACSTDNTSAPVDIADGSSDAVADVQLEDADLDIFDVADVALEVSDTDYDAVDAEVVEEDAQADATVDVLLDAAVDVDASEDRNCFDFEGFSVCYDLLPYDEAVEACQSMDMDILLNDSQETNEMVAAALLDEVIPSIEASQPELYEQLNGNGVHFFFAFDFDAYFTWGPGYETDPSRLGPGTCPVWAYPTYIPNWKILGCALPGMFVCEHT